MRNIFAGAPKHLFALKAKVKQTDKIIVIDLFGLCHKRKNLVLNPLNAIFEQSLLQAVVSLLS